MTNANDLLKISRGYKARIDILIVDINRLQDLLDSRNGEIDAEKGRWASEVSSETKQLRI